MKIAGTKNPGAWHRYCKRIQTLTDEERANLAGILNTLPSCAEAYNALHTLQTRAGITTPAIAASKSEWMNNLCDDGIPLQVWMGHLSYTSYVKEGDKYFPEFQNEMRHFGNHLRSAVVRYFLTRRQIRDLFNKGGAKDGNPGGLPDGNPVT